MGFLYRLVLLAIMALLVGSVIGALHSGRLIVSLSVDSATLIVEG